MSALVPFEQQRTIAKAFVESGLFGVKNEAQALALMAICEAEGLHPAKAVQEFHIVQGRPAMKSDAMLARFQKAGGKVSWSVYSDEDVTGTFSHPQGGSVEIKWTIAQARRIGLAGKDNWKNYPRAMLRARCISEGVRTVYPGIATGIYTVEEMQDMPTAQVMQMQPDATQPEPVPELPAGRYEAIESLLQACASMDEVAHVWSSITKDERKATAHLKDEAKVRLSEEAA